jgi:hypothetical protein
MGIAQPTWMGVTKLEIIIQRTRQVTSSTPNDLHHQRHVMLPAGQRQLKRTASNSNHKS